MWCPLYLHQECSPDCFYLDSTICLICTVEHTQFGCVLEHQLYKAFSGFPCNCIPEEIFWIRTFFFIHCLATKLNSVILLIVFLSFCYIQVYATAFPTGWLGNIQKMFVCCTNSIGSPKVGDSPTWGTERVEFVRRKCFDKNSSDWETWFYIKANFSFFCGFFSHSVAIV